MDWNDIRNQVSNLSLYDLKAGVRKVQNAVMNYTPMEAKVREATNNEPWGASSTLMQDIANATFNYQLLNEIMPMIYKRFTEKSAEEWRQIYKALQLMEFLVKNGSERVIDDARSHMSLLKMLRQFHFIDQNGKDQGINVRNRSKELVELLSDVDRIRSERKKAKTTRNKYGGVEGGRGLGGSSSQRYGGFGSESGNYGADFGGSTRGVYGDGGGFGGETHDEYDEGGQRGGAERFDEYDEYDDGGAQAAPSRRKAATSSTTTSSTAASTSRRSTQKKPEPAKPKEPEVDLFEFGDEPISAPSNGFAALPQPSSALAPPSSNIMGSSAADDDDDFDDFQTAAPASAPAPAKPQPNYSAFSTMAPTSTTQFAQPTPQFGTQQANLFSAVQSPPATSAFSPPAQQAPKPSGYQPSGPNYFTSVQIQPSEQQAFSSTGTKVASPTGTFGASGAKKTSGSGDAFAGLLSGSSMKNTAAPVSKGLSMADMAKQKSQAGLYGANAPSAPAANYAANPTSGGTGSSGLDDLLG